MTRKHSIVALFLLAGFVIATPSSSEASWFIKAGYKRYVDPLPINIFRLTTGNDYKVVKMLHINVQSALEVNGKMFVGQLGIGLKLKFELAKMVKLTFQSDFIFDAGVTFDKEDGFYGLGGLFGPGIEIRLGPIGLIFDVTFEVGRFLSVDTLITTSRKPLWWGVNAQAGIAF